MSRARASPGIPVRQGSGDIVSKLRVSENKAWVLLALCGIEGKRRADPPACVKVFPNSCVPIWRRKPFPQESRYRTLIVLPKGGSILDTSNTSL